jgi:hypothetical protein
MLRAADVDGVIEALQALADPERAALVRPYLGVVAGDHADGDEILGMPVPAQRGVARAAPPARSGAPARAELMRFHLDHRAGMNNWDLVGSSAREPLGVGLIDGDRAILWELVASERLRDRRIAIVSAHALLR